VAGLAAELEDQNVINEGYLSSAECNALVVSACRAPLRKVTRLVRPPAGADDHMVTRFFSLHIKGEGFFFVKWRYSSSEEEAAVVR
jgi:hypothetical protein